MSLKVSRKTIAIMLRNERQINRLQPRWAESNAAIRHKVYGSVTIARSVTGTTLEPKRFGLNDDTTGYAFPSFAWPGGYTIEYVTDDGSVLCADCAREAVICDRETLHYDTYDEGPDVECDGGCGHMLESSYGDPDAEEEETPAPDGWTLVNA